MPGRPMTRHSHVILAEMASDPDWWPGVLDRVACGDALKTIFDEIGVLYGVGRRWVDADETRAKEYAQAERYHAESLAFETISIADSARPEDVAVQKLRGDARWRIASKLDRGRWGEKEGLAGGGVTVIVQKFANDTVTLEASGQTLTMPAEQSTRVIDVSRETDVSSHAPAPAVETPHLIAATL